MHAFFLRRLLAVYAFRPTCPGQGNEKIFPWLLLRKILTVYDVPFRDQGTGVANPLVKIVGGRETFPILRFVPICQVDRKRPYPQESGFLTLFRV